MNHPGVSGNSEISPIECIDEMFVYENSPSFSHQF